MSSFDFAFLREESGGEREQEGRRKREVCYEAEEGECEEGEALEKEEETLKKAGHRTRR